VRQPHGLWIVARWSVLLITIALTAMFWVIPDWSLSVLWYVLVPVLPVIFMINVRVWRNVCPLATLNLLSDSVTHAFTPPKNWPSTAGMIGIGLLVLLVPARRFLFNVDATALGVTVVGVGLLALAGGMLFEMKAGFCNAICPILPIERLYGQRPLVDVSNARCVPCTACTKGCLDLTPAKSALLLVGRGKSKHWSVTGYGAFALALPGFVLGYYQLQDGTWSDAGFVYATVAGWSLASWIVLTSLFRLLRTETRIALLVCATLAISAYYWYGSAAIAAEFGFSTGFEWATRFMTLSITAMWLTRGLREPVGGRKRAKVVLKHGS
jgi:nitrite reductase (NADH) large subunit